MLQLIKLILQQTQLRQSRRDVIYLYCLIDMSSITISLMVLSRDYTQQKIIRYKLVV